MKRFFQRVAAFILFAGVVFTHVGCDSSSNNSVPVANTNTNTSTSILIPGLISPNTVINTNTNIFTYTFTSIATSVPGFTPLFPAGLISTATTGTANP
ncbi:MAG: hypothetical protein HQM08_20280 [Candidatus Riflebacteria bacterium]|nr:hypothetical protein [Candidatus Riflebacteria bacterium]